MIVATELYVLSPLLDCFNSRYSTAATVNVALSYKDGQVQRSTYVAELSHSSCCLRTSCDAPPKADLVAFFHVLDFPAFSSCVLL